MKKIKMKNKIESKVKLQGVRVPFFTLKKPITPKIGFCGHGLVKPKCARSM